MNILCFRYYPSYSEEENNVDVVWQFGNAEYLSYLFSVQLERNKYLFNILQQKFLKDSYAQELMTLRADESTYPIYLEKRRKKRSHLLDAYMILQEDLLPMDESTIYQEGYNTEVYVVVLLEGVKYLGHLYAWISPDRSMLFAMGIRKSIEFMIENTKLNVAPYLFEGVRQLALNLGYKQFSIVSPYPHVASILSKLGFSEQNVKYEQIGISPSYSDIEQYEFIATEDRDVYTSGNLLEPISVNPTNILIQH